MDSAAILRSLRIAGVMPDLPCTLTSLSGGVSCDIGLLECGPVKLVVKQALPKLRVKDEWFADVARNRYEQLYMRYVAGFLPRAVPKIVYSDDVLGFFAMEYLGEGYRNWKSLLMSGDTTSDYAQQAGHILGTIHRRSWKDATVQSQFETTETFSQLRADAYLITTGRRHPRLSSAFEKEAHRILNTRLCLVHGDYSPKNMLIGPDRRLVVLDCEVAWFGDPAFDLAFLFNHFMLKALYHHADPAPFIQLASTAWNAYERALNRAESATLRAHVARLQPMLMLARVDGKSPAEYITDECKQNLVRSFVTSWVERETDDLQSLWDTWNRAIQEQRLN